MAPISSHTQLLMCGGKQRKVQHYPHLQLQSEYRDFACREKLAVLKTALNLLPKELISFSTNHEEDQAKGSVKNSAVVVKGNLEQTGRFTGERDNWEAPLWGQNKS